MSTVRIPYQVRIVALSVVYDTDTKNVAECEYLCCLVVVVFVVQQIRLTIHDHQRTPHIGRP